MITDEEWANLYYKSLYLLSQRMSPDLHLCGESWFDYKAFYASPRLDYKHSFCRICRKFFILNSSDDNDAEFVKDHGVQHLKEYNLLPFI